MKSALKVLLWPMMESDHVFTDANTAYAGIGVSGASQVNNYGNIDNWNLQDASIIRPGGMSPNPISRGQGSDSNAPVSLHFTAEGGSFGLTFSGSPNSTYSVWASTNLLDWQRLGTATEVSPGQYQFEDEDPISFQHCFYRISAP